MRLSGPFNRAAKFFFFFLFILIVSAIVSVPARAAETETPDQALLRYLAKLQETKSMLAIIDDVDWETALTFFPVERHNSIINASKVNTPEELRNYYIEIFGDPKARVEKIRKRMINDVTSHGLKTDNIDDNVAGIESVFSRFQINLQAAIQMSTFKTGPVKIEGQRAYVELLTTRTGITTSKQITMVNKDGKWLLAEPNIVTMKGQKVIPPGMGQKGPGPQSSGAGGMVPPGMSRPGGAPIGPSPAAGPIVGE